MRRIKVIALVALALAGLGALAATSAYAEDPNSPSILVGSGVATELTGTFKNPTGAKPELIDLSGEKNIPATGAEAKLKGCKEITGSPKDTNLCEAAIDFTGYKQGAAACRSENNKGEKDPVETVLAKLDLHLAAEESLEGTAEMTLQPLLLAFVLGTAGEEEVKFVCGLVKIKEEGVLGCLVAPGLGEVAAGGKYTITCVVSSTTHDAVIGHCELLCEPFGSTHPIGVKADLNGSTSKDAWELIELEGSFPVAATIDD